MGNENDNEVLRFASCAVPLRPGWRTAPVLVNSYISDKPFIVRHGGGIWADNQINFQKIARLFNFISIFALSF